MFSVKEKINILYFFFFKYIILCFMAEGTFISGEKRDASSCGSDDFSLAEVSRKMGCNDGEIAFLE